MEQPQRVILFLIDGLHWEAPKRLNMPVFNSLRTEGAYVEQSNMILPHHPTIGDYGRMHTTSFPNPVLQEGTLFLKTGNKMLQEMFGVDPTAFVANTTAYTSVSRGFDFNIHQNDMSDEQVVEQSMELLVRYPIKYFRIHLQNSGNQGRYLSYTDESQPYFRNIWGENSPYVKSVEQADRLLGKLVNFLKTDGKWETTLLVVSSDHGQSVQGWHPIADPDSWTTPLLFVGPGIARDKVLPYFEHTDITPTIAALMQVNPPNTDGGAGVSRKALLSNDVNPKESYPEYVKIINEQINTYNLLRAEMMLRGKDNFYFSSLITYLENELLTPEPFYHHDRFTEWHRAGTTEHLIEVNRQILSQMEKELSK